MDKPEIFQVNVEVEGAGKKACKEAVKKSFFKRGKAIMARRVITKADGTKSYKK